jgi:hypothetical protein
MESWVETRWALKASDEQGPMEITEGQSAWR